MQCQVYQISHVFRRQLLQRGSSATLTLGKHTHLWHGSQRLRNGLGALVSKGEHKVTCVNNNHHSEEVHCRYVNPRVDELVLNMPRNGSLARK